MMRYVFLLLICCVAVVNVGADDAGNDGDALAHEISQLQAAYAAWQRNDAEFRELRKQDPTCSPELREFAEFVATLKREVIERCEVVRRLGGDMSQHGVDCVKLEDEAESKNSGALPNIEREPTEKEKITVLMSQIEQLESEHDEMILKYQPKPKGQEEVSTSNGDWAGGFDGSGTDDSSEASETADVGEPTDGSVSELGSDGEPIGRKVEPGAGPGVDKQGEMPEFDIENAPDGSDDDVVARQLREAAEAETDQYLKEQLWTQYKKYKASTR